MSDYLIKGETLTGIADAIRSKTGSTGPIVVSDMASQIEGITGGGSGGGGGSVEGVHYVTFMSEDGTTELYKRPVADGDDCADPVDRKLIPAPTKASTAQYNYTHAGWSATPGGAMDSNILKSVTGDKTVYACFAAVLRYYTITYYDSDGTTVLKTESLAYGAMPSYAPTKDGYAFDSWSPAVATVTENASYTAVWHVKKSLNDFTWAELDAMSLADCKANFSLGDKKRVTIANTAAGNTYTTQLTLVGFEVDDLADGSGKAKMSFVTPTIGVISAWGIFASDYWPNSALKTDYMSKLESWSAKSEDHAALNTVVKSVAKKYMSNTSGPVISTINEKYWMPSMSELGFTNLGIADEGTRYPLFNDKTVKDTLHNAGYMRFVTRSMHSTYSPTYVWSVNNGSASVNTKNPATTGYVSLGVCI